MKRVVINIDGPGSSGTLALDCSEKEVEFLERLREEWNQANALHAQPSIEIEVYQPVERRDEKAA